MAETLSTILTSVGSFITASVGWMGEFADVITSNALIFIFAVAVPLVGLGIGLLRRMLNAN